MVTVKLVGGLGNQMFQYAAGRKLAVHNKTKLKLDLSQLGREYENVTKRNFALDIFKIDCSLQAKQNRLVKKISTLFNPVTKLTEQEYQSDSVVENIGSNICLDGYWQSELYFNSIESIIRADFDFKIQPNEKNKAYLNQINNVNAVSIHFRRGDYVTLASANQFHGLCSVDYYREAIATIKNRVINPWFFIFSDDLNWVKENFIFDTPHTFIEGNDDAHSFEDMRLMSNCKHNIIANSSFSWWGAWLNKNDQKCVIAPRKWYSNDEMNNASINMVPPNWIRL